MIGIMLFLLAWPVVSFFFWMAIFMAVSVLLYWIAWLCSGIGVQVNISGWHLPACLFGVVCLVTFYSCDYCGTFFGIINGACGAYSLLQTLSLWIIEG